MNTNLLESYLIRMLLARRSLWENTSGSYYNLEVIYFKNYI